MRYLFILLLLCGSVFGQDEEPNIDSTKIIIKGVDYWKSSSLTTASSKEDYTDYWKHTGKGGIISIIEGNRNLGKLDIPPKIICIVVTGLAKKDAMLYLDPLTDKDSDTILIKEKKSYLSESVVDSAIVLWNKDKSYLRITNTQLKSWMNTYTQSEIELKITNEEIK